jgi:hypothetical protein
MPPGGDPAWPGGGKGNGIFGGSPAIFGGGKGMPPGGIGAPGPPSPPGGMFGGGKGIGGILGAGPPRPMNGGGGMPGIPVQVSIATGLVARKSYLAVGNRAAESLGLQVEETRPSGSGSLDLPGLPHCTRP